MEEQLSTPAEPCEPRPIKYDFTKAEEYLKMWYTPQELSQKLRDAALRCGELYDLNDVGTSSIVIAIQLAAIEVCEFIDKIAQEE